MHSLCCGRPGTCVVPLPTPWWRHWWTYGIPCPPDGASGKVFGVAGDGGWENKFSCLVTLCSGTKTRLSVLFPLSLPVTPSGFHLVLRPNKPNGLTVRSTDEWFAKMLLLHAQSLLWSAGYLCGPPADPLVAPLVDVWDSLSTRWRQR